MHFGQTTRGGVTEICDSTRPSLAGRTMRVAPGRCGIQFDAPLAVADWMPIKMAAHHSPEASATRLPLAPVPLSFDPAPVALDRKVAAPDAVSDHLAAVAESEPANTARAIEELVSLQSDMRVAHEELERRGVDNHAEPEALATALKRVEGIAMALRNV